MESERCVLRDGRRHGDGGEYNRGAQQGAVEEMKVAHDVLVMTYGRSADMVVNTRHHHNTASCQRLSLPLSALKHQNPPPSVVREKQLS